MDEGHAQEVGSQWNWGFGWMWRSLGRFTELDALGNQLRASAQQPEGSRHPWLCLGRLRPEEKEGKGSKWKETISFWDAAPGSLFNPVLLSLGKLCVLGGNSAGKHLHKLWTELRKTPRLQNDEENTAKPWSDLNTFKSTGVWNWIPGSHARVSGARVLWHSFTDRD